MSKAHELYSQRTILVHWTLSEQKTLSFKHLNEKKKHSRTWDEKMQNIINKRDIIKKSEYIFIGKINDEIKTNSAISGWLLLYNVA